MQLRRPKPCCADPVLRPPSEAPESRAAAAPKRDEMPPNPHAARPAAAALPRPVLFYPLARIFTISFLPGRSACRSLKLFTSGYHLGLLWFTFWQAAVSTLLTLALALPGACVMALLRIPGSNATNPCHNPLRPADGGGRQRLSGAVGPPRTGEPGADGDLGSPRAADPAAPVGWTILLPTCSTTMRRRGA